MDLNTGMRSIGNGLKITMIKIQTNLIIQNSWDLPELVDTGPDPHEDFHTYAIEWTPDDVSFFIDDELVRFVNNFYADSMYHYQKIMMKDMAAYLCGLGR